jgi:tetratricopeptide (TPR) repeat protein
VTPAVDAIVLKLLAPNRDDRYATAADLREDLERHLADKPLAHAPNTSTVERVRKWRRRNPRLAAGLTACLAALVLLVMPAAAVAVRQDQIAKRTLATQKAEAAVRRTAALDRARTAQVLLSTQDDRQLLDAGVAMGRAVLADYGVGKDAAWTGRPDFRLLSDAEQAELRRELGELLLLLARAEALKHPDDPAAGQEWSRLADACYPADERTEFVTYHDGHRDATAGRHAEALAKLAAFTDRHPGHYMAWYARGISHYAVGQWAEAAAAFGVCAALKPEMPWSYFDRGLVRLQQKNFAAAEADFATVLRLPPDPALTTHALVNRAIAREGRSDWAGADADLTAALDRADAPTRAYFLRSRVRRKAGDDAGADRDKAEGFKHTPADAVSWVTRGLWRVTEKSADAKAAVEDFDEALAADPRSRSALQNKALVLADYLNQPKDAVAALDRLLELYPAYTEARAGRGVYLARIGDGARARRDAEASLMEEPTPYRYYQMAGLHAQLAKHEGDGPARREAFRLLAVALRSGFANFELIDKDSDLDPIRGSDEFKGLVAHAKALQR